MLNQVIIDQKTYLADQFMNIFLICKIVILNPLRSLGEYLNN